TRGVLSYAGRGALAAGRSDDATPATAPGGVAMRTALAPSARHDAADSLPSAARATTAWRRASGGSHTRAEPLAASAPLSPFHEPFVPSSATHALGFAAASARA